MKILLHNQVRLNNMSIYQFQCDFSIWVGKIRMVVGNTVFLVQAKDGHFGIDKRVFIQIVKSFNLVDLRKIRYCYRSSYRRCSIKKLFLENFAVFTEKHLSWSLLLKKLQAVTKFLRTPYLKNICEWLLLLLEQAINSKILN